MFQTNWRLVLLWSGEAGWDWVDHIGRWVSSCCYFEYRTWFSISFHLHQSECNSHCFDVFARNLDTFTLVADSLAQWVSPSLSIRNLACYGWFVSLTNHVHLHRFIQRCAWGYLSMPCWSILRYLQPMLLVPRPTQGTIHFYRFRRRPVYQELHSLAKHALDSNSLHCCHYSHLLASHYFHRNWVRKDFTAVFLFQLWQQPLPLHKFFWSAQD